MFRHPLPGIVRFLMALAFCAGAAAPALAVDVQDVSFRVIIARSSLVADEITARFCVLGTDLDNGTITFPGTTTQIPLERDPDGSSCDDDQPVLGFSLDFDSEAALATLLPTGNYVLRVNAGAVQATIPYVRPAVPSPAISQPDAGAVLPPGPLEVLFTACHACNLGLDSVEAELEGDATASETLTEDDEAWVPQGMGGNLALPEDGEFLVRITHTAVREGNAAASLPDEDGIVAISEIFVQSDEVDFRTGFNPPEGDFCVVVNPAAPVAGCSPLDDDLLFLLDTSGMVPTTVAGLDVDYDFDVDAKGNLIGTGSADLDDNGSKETTGAIKGKLKGKAGELKQKLSFPLVNELLEAKLKVSVSDVLSIPLDSLERTQKASGNLGAVKVKEEDVTNPALSFPPLGWRVNFTVAADGAVSNGLLTLDGGRMFPLEGTNKFNLAKNESSLKLQSPDKGIKLQLKKVVLDDEASPSEVVGGSLNYKILGQSGKADLPAGP